LAGFVIGELRQGIVNPENSRILNTLGESLDLIKDQVIDPMNYIEACIEALERAKKTQSYNQGSRSPKKPSQRNGMRNE
jgi:hypothetical protein